MKKIEIKINKNKKYENKNWLIYQIECKLMLQALTIKLDILQNRNADAAVFYD